MSAGVLVPWNPSARRAGSEGLRLRQLERAAGVARAAAQRGLPLILAAGWRRDGRGSVAQGLMGVGESTRLGILPLGSANDFARLLAREPMPLAADGDPLPPVLRFDVRVRRAALGPGLRAVSPGRESS